ncbi:uncharacterized protein LOC132612929 [Lycium barbarum]|uniref:uncharacterized protein LOC132612929 n=1 Tax=Lycium barbarum TaxID=112863 RepID=UPI00293EF7F7|nr:uncharacterized protein LOC132612929 [Lycium barbarum]
MPNLPKYDGTTDPQEHVTSYICDIKGNDMQPNKIESVLLKKFGETLSKGAITWYSLLPEHSIRSFKMLADAFIKIHSRTKKVLARKAIIFKIAQGDVELLYEFLIRFQKEQMLLPAVPVEWPTEAFTKGLNPRSSSSSLKLKENLLGFLATTWVDVHNRYESKIRVEDDQFRLPDESTARSQNHDRLRRNVDTISILEIKIPTSKSPTVDSVTNNIENLRLSEYNFNVDLVKLVATISKIDGAKRPRLMRSDPSQRDMNLFCNYHRTHGHWISDYRQLRDEVARLLKDSHLREFLSERAKDNCGKNRDLAKQEVQTEPRHVINMITDEPMQIKEISLVKKEKLPGINRQRALKFE